jgi:hypothetical protein
VLKTGDGNHRRNALIPFGHEPFAGGENPLPMATVTTLNVRPRSVTADGGSISIRAN